MYITKISYSSAGMLRAHQPLEGLTHTCLVDMSIPWGVGAGVTTHTPGSTLALAHCTILLQLESPSPTFVQVPQLQRHSAPRKRLLVRM